VRRQLSSFNPKARRWWLPAPASARQKPPRRRCPGSKFWSRTPATWPLPRSLVDQVKTKHGRIDVLFVNAGIAEFAPIAQVDEAFYDSQFNVNVKGAFFLLKHAIPIIPDGGAIILTASVSGAAGGLGGSTIYGATKAALRSFGRTIAKELTPRGIGVNTISPGPIVTPILDKCGFTPAQKDAFIEGAKTRIPLGRSGTAAEVAAAALYLAADATYTTGAELFVDGGLIDL
jgi:NAD(P)-dependent dehydrogenase (short-subunit alcohol dehydrogenase family)